MTPDQISFAEKTNTGTTWTRNEAFDKNGFLPIEQIWDPKELYSDVPELKGQYNYYDKNPEHFNHVSVESQVEGSTSRYWHPQYRQIHTGIRLKLEKLLGRKLYNTYYYDRFYYPGQELKRHTDRDACEISVTVHVSTNLTGDDANWPICIKKPDRVEGKETIIGESSCLSLEPGDGVVYKGCERPHWRDPMPKGEDEETEYYYHQIFFHYVLADGHRVHCAGDSSR